ncbi:hypothetical protein LENED_005166 [Lentinula edodes]|uniref:Uncharacterized protein n=1 Tax=Lentinula edodes TaxID=5353 RepID=A0A1Q3E891_LENED|nr:hypothetical protein LENED_005166 [Lentinula edodes]
MLPISNISGDSVLLDKDVVLVWEVDRFMRASREKLENGDNNVPRIDTVDGPLPLEVREGGRERMDG